MIAALTLAASAITLTLTQAVDTALAHNLPYLNAQAAVRRAAGEVVTARSASYPAAGIAYAHQTQSAYSIPVAGPYEFGSPQIDQLAAVAQWTLYNGGAITANQGIASANFVAAVQQYAAARNDVVALTTQEYYGLIAARQDAEIGQSNVQDAAANTIVARQRFAAGVAPKADVLRQQLDEANARTVAIAAANAASVAQAVLAHELAMPANTAIVTADPLEPPVASYDRAALARQAQRKRPELRAAEAAVDAAGYAVRVARASSLPAIAVAASESNTQPGTLGAAQPQLATTLTATWRLFDGGYSRGNVESAVAAVDQASLQLAQLRNDIDLEVERSYDDYVAARARIDAAAAARNYGAETLRLARVRYAAGVGTALELTDARQADARARADYVDAVASAQTAQAALLRASGG